MGIDKKEKAEMNKWDMMGTHNSIGGRRIPVY